MELLSWDIAINIGLAAGAALFLLFSKVLDNEHQPLKVLFFFVSLFLVVHLFGFNVTTYQAYGANYNSTINDTTGLWFPSSLDSRIDNQLSSIYQLSTYVMYLSMIYLVFYMMFKFFKKGEDNLQND